jgi:hypothetical protein
MTLRSRRTRCLAGIPFPALAQGRDSSDIPLVGFNPPLRFVPETSVLRLSTQDHSHGICFPFNAYRQRESTSAPCYRFGCPTQPEDRVGVRWRVPLHQLRCRSQAFSTSQRLSPLTALLPFSDRWRSWGSPFRGFILSRSLRQLITTGLPSCRSSRRVRSPKVLGLELLWARDPLPRMGRHHAIYRLQGLCPRENQPGLRGTIDYVPSSRLAPPGLSPPHGIDPHQRAGLTLRDRHAWEAPGPLPDQETSCASRLDRC